MKFRLILVFVLALLSFSSCKEENTTTYYLIRHAEKDRTDSLNRNPNLNKNGLLRAKKWAEYFKSIDLDAVYSTNYNRTLQTATPTAEQKNLTIKLYNPRKMYDSVFQLETKGQSVLVVGHSNTTPFFANKILGKKTYDQMDDRDNSSLYIVKLKKDKKITILEKVD